MKPRQGGHQLAEKYKRRTVEPEESGTGSGQGTKLVPGGKEEGSLSDESSDPFDGNADATCGESSIATFSLDLPADGQKRAYDKYPIPTAPDTATIDL